VASTAPEPPTPELIVPLIALVSSPTPAPITALRQPAMTPSSPGLPDTSTMDKLGAQQSGGSLLVVLGVMLFAVSLVMTARFSPGEDVSQAR
jgi:hypothetical protein